MKVGVVVFPGSNCDQDIIDTLRGPLGQHVETLWHKDHDLRGCELVVLPGGFSYGDYLRSGAIARFSPIMQEIGRHAQRGGYVLGICNGFQVLTEAHLVPGALLRNQERHFVCQNAWVQPVSRTAALTRDLDPAHAYCIPVAHGEGRYYADDATLAQLADGDQILFRYCAPTGVANAEEANFNGSRHGIAGVCNATHTVFGLMPHPERAADHDLGNTDGLPMLTSLLRHIGGA
ncbi:MAG: phosphoribosylformylglycinamidine synthase subunit PurQ [Hymenobacteraceae bacterium]|nr:phosphoribosylformylglycinamidine synthase subunit PurQ [Hymenobacteraceae bacterium]